VPVPSGLNVAALPGASVFGDTPPDTPETVSFVLREQNKPQLEAAVVQGLRKFLTVGQRLIQPPDQASAPGPRPTTLRFRDKGPELKLEFGSRSGAPGARTQNPRIKSPLLYH
jgi:hypothetical protein